MNTGDFSVWYEGAPILQVGTYSADFSIWADGSPLLELGGGGGQDPVKRRRTWVAFYDSMTLRVNYVIARFTFEDGSLSSWLNGPTVEILETFDFEDESLDAWPNGELSTAFASETHDFEDESLALWTTG